MQPIFSLISTTTTFVSPFVKSLSLDNAQSYINITSNILQYEF